MKKLLLFLVISLLLTLASIAQEWGFTARYPLVDATMFSAVTNTRATVPFASLFIEDEGTWSDYLSAQYGDYDYFSVAVTNGHGGTILKMSHFGLDAWGIPDPRTTFVDMLSGRSYPVTLVRHGEIILGEYTLDSDGFINEEWFEGELIVNGLTIHLLVFYFESPNQPSILLTWGDGSDLYNVGLVLDIFSGAMISPVLTNTTVFIEKYKGSEFFKPGDYLDTKTLWPSVEVQYSTNLNHTNWIALTNHPYAIYGDTWSYYLGTNGGPQRYFRAKKK